MEQISIELKRRREELGYTIEEISRQTSLSVKNIKQLESGDLSGFREDLSYVPFYLKNYCKVLDIDYNHVRSELENSIESYTEAIKLKDLDEKNLIQEHIQKTIIDTTKKRKINYGFLSLIFIIIFVLIITIYSTFTIFFKNTNQTEKKQPVVTNESVAEKSSIAESTATKEDISKIVITEETPTSYIITLAKTSEFMVDLKTDSWLSFNFVKQKEATTLEEKVYKANENPKIKVNSDDIIEVRVGALRGNTFKINEQEIPFNSALNQDGVHTFKFTFKGN